MRLFRHSRPDVYGRKLSAMTILLVLLAILVVLAAVALARDLPEDGYSTRPAPPRPYDEASPGPRLPV